MSTKTHPIHRIVGVFVKNLDENPRIQLKIHRVGFWYWIFNFPIVTYMFFFQPHFWEQYGLFITLIYSIYANFTSDYTGMSASQSVINTSKTADKVDDMSDDIYDLVAPAVAEAPSLDML